MCGRYSGGWSGDKFAKVFNVQPSLFDNYNVSPTQFAPIIWQKSRREVLKARWGLIPSWVREPTDFKASLFNARAESLHEKASFKGPFQRQRCLVPALGFFEWKSEGKNKQPHFIRRTDGNVVAFAGLYDCWQKGHEDLYSYAIITTCPNEVMSSIHNRMPVILESAEFDLWLEGSVSEAETLLRPYQGLLEAYPVSKRVGKTSENDKDLLEPERSVLGRFVH
jgi:putative SOS response-associated peptidase YedK